MSKEKRRKQCPFSFEAIIRDENGRKIFHWKPGHNNLMIGMGKTSEYIHKKLGIDVGEEEEVKRVLDAFGIRVKKK